MTPPELRAALADGIGVPDGDFDTLYPDELLPRSELQWTPVSIALRAASMLDLPAGTRVLDVGCGVGKTCLVAQIATGIRWWGVERETALVEAANHAAWRLGVRDDVRFVNADAWSIDWNQFDAFYFFNPFPLPPTAPGNAFAHYGVFVAECVKAEERLATLRSGTRILTYHGFGGDMPDGYELARTERAGTDALRLWIRR